MNYWAPPPSLSDLNLRIDLMRLREKAGDKEDWPLASILDVAIRTLDRRIEENTPALPATPPTALTCRNVRVKGKRTSVKLEEAFWDALESLTRETKCSLNDLCDAASDLHGAHSLTSALRVFVLLNLYPDKSFQ